MTHPVCGASQMQMVPNTQKSGTHQDVEQQSTQMAPQYFHRACQAGDHWCRYVILPSLGLVCILCCIIILCVINYKLAAEPVNFCSLCMFLLACNIFIGKLHKMVHTVFNTPFLLLIMELMFAQLWGLITQYRRMDFGNRRDLAMWFVTCLASAGSMASYSAALFETTMTVYLLTGGILPIICIVTERCLLKMSIQSLEVTTPSLLLIFTGNLLYGYDSMYTTPFGKTLVFINSGFTLCERFLQTSLLTRDQHFSITPPSCAFLSASVGVCVLLGLAASTGEVSTWRAQVARADASTWCFLALSGGCRACSGYAVVKAQTMVSGTTILVVQSSIMMLLISVSIRLKGGWGTYGLQENITGLTLSLIGCVLYGLLMLRSQNAKGVPWK